MAGPYYWPFSFWWILPIVMIALCCFMFRGRRRGTMCGFGRRMDSGRDAAMGILQRRYAGGEIDIEDYESRKRILAGSGSPNQE